MDCRWWNASNADCKWFMQCVDSTARHELRIFLGYTSYTKEFKHESVSYSEEKQSSKHLPRNYNCVVTSITDSAFSYFNVAMRNKYKVAVRAIIAILLLLLGVHIHGIISSLRTGEKKGMPANCIEYVDIQNRLATVNMFHFGVIQILFVRSTIVLCLCWKFVRSSLVVKFIEASVSEPHASKLLNCNFSYCINVVRGTSFQKKSWWTLERMIWWFIYASIYTRPFFAVHGVTLTRASLLIHRSSINQRDA